MWGGLYRRVGMTSNRVESPTGYSPADALRMRGTAVQADLSPRSRQFWGSQIRGQSSHRCPCRSFDWSFARTFVSGGSSSGSGQLITPPSSLLPPCSARVAGVREAPDELKAALIALMCIPADGSSSGWATTSARKDHALGWFPPLARTRALGYFSVPPTCGHVGATHYAAQRRSPRGGSGGRTTMARLLTLQVSLPMPGLFRKQEV